MSPDHLFCYPELRTVNIHHCDNLYDSLREKVYFRWQFYVSACDQCPHCFGPVVRKGIMAGTCERANPFTLWWEAKRRMRKGLGSHDALWGNAIKNLRTLHKPLFLRLLSLPNSTSWRTGLQHGSLWGTFEIQTITSTEWDRTSTSSLYLLIFRKTSQRSIHALATFMLWNSFKLTEKVTRVFQMTFFLSLSHFRINCWHDVPWFLQHTRTI